MFTDEIEVFVAKRTRDEWHELRPLLERQRASVRPCVSIDGRDAGGQRRAAHEVRAMRLAIKRCVAGDRGAVSELS